ncbi:C1 family peptidase [uncultured Eubacterium sp.]|uniref:C1 family peptidase n=1 Tax=uncultured Eubacterium sp. TaxID=165185 RepID=UPI00267152C0|nr:C1 family peptidase [uncultured Eubacterium sp.]
MMRKSTKRWMAMMLSITMVLGTITYQPVRANEDSGDAPPEEVYATGAIPEDLSKISDDMKINSLEEYYDILEKEGELDEPPVPGAGLEEELYGSIDLSTSEYFPEITNQGGLGACTSFAQTYYQFTYEMNRKMNRAATTESTLSPIYPYNLIANNNGNSGANPARLYSLLQHKGTIPWSGTEYSRNPKTWFPTKENWNKADNYRLKKYYFFGKNLGNSGNEISSPKDSKLNIIKSMLNMGQVVCITTYISSRKEETLGQNSPHAGEMIITDILGQQGCHRMTIVGYDDNIWVDINGDGQVQEAEKGAFKIANSWGDNWGNDGFCWFAYDAINIKSQVTGETHMASPTWTYSCGLYDFSVITVTDYNSDSDIKLEYTLNTNSRKELKISVMATDIESGQIYTNEATPYYIEDGNSDSRNLSFDGTEGMADGTMTMDLDTVVPGLTSDTFGNYVWNVEFSETTDNSYRTVVKDVKIVDYNIEKEYQFDASYPQTINGNKIELECNSNAQGYDLQVTDISYVNLETGEENGRIEPGDRIRFESKIKNVGDTKIKENQKFSVLFTSDEKTVWNSGKFIQSELGVADWLSVPAVSGEEAGVITFSETGTYSVTAWANYNNILTEEYGGNAAENNKKTITIQVLPQEGGIKVTSFTASDEEIQYGDTVTFNITLKYGNTVQTKFDISNSKGMYLYRSDYMDGTQMSYQFNTTGLYYVFATIKDVNTGEEVKTTQYVRIYVKDKETGYDFEVNSLSYNLSDSGTKGKVYVGDSIYPRARVKNVGEINAPDNEKLRISFQIENDIINKMWNDEYSGKIGIKAGESKILSAKAGGQNGDGSYTFTEPGTYTLTAWVNDTNEISGELGGYTANNNKQTITFQVYPKESMNTVEEFEADKTSVLQGEIVNFAIISYPVISALRTKLDIYTESGDLYDSIGYQYGMDRDYCFEEVGTFYVQATIVETFDGEKGITSRIAVTVDAANGYDLAVGTIGYQNQDTNEINGQVVVGEPFKFYSVIKNVGTQTVNENGGLIVNFRIQGKDTDVTLSYDNNTLMTYLQAGYVGAFQSNKGGENNDGSYIFSKAGTYTLTVSVNDDNRFPDEICGNTAKNNKNSMTIKVVEPSSITINKFTANGKEISQGDSVTFTIDCELLHMSHNRYEIYNEDGTLYEKKGIDYSLSRKLIFEDPGTYDVQAVIEDLTTGEIKRTEKIRIIVTQTDGYDLAVTDIRYVNVDTAYNGGNLKPGDRIRLQAMIKNVGNAKARDNTLMKITYQIAGKNPVILYNDQFKNRTGLAAGQSTRLNSNKGGVNDDGIITLTESGTYTFTVSVNDDNAFPDEICGNKAKNNKKTITVNVAEPEKRIQLGSFDASTDEIFKGGMVEFSADVSNVSSAMIKLHVYGLNGMIYHGSYFMGTEVNYQFQQEGTYYVQATIVDPHTSEEVDTGFIRVVVKSRES